MRSTFADGSPLAAGPRIPTIVISPWAAAGTISHNYSEHSSLIKLINTIFGLVPLADLPDEKKGKAMGAELGQTISARRTSEDNGWATCSRRSITPHAQTSR